MIHLAIQRKPETLENYFERDITVGTNGLTPTWFGSLAPRLGLHGEIPRNEESFAVFRNLARGCSPNGAPLLASALPGSKHKRRVGYDVTVAAPKTVTVAALVGGDHRVLEAHRRAIRTLLTEIENRARISYSSCRLSTRAIIGAEFVHTRSRENNDPHLHSHLILLNLTRVDPAKLPPSSPCPWKALDPVKIYSDSVLLDLIYKSELAYCLRHYGYSVCIDKNSPELSIISPSDRIRFSSAKRRINELERACFGTNQNPIHRVWVNDRFRKSKTHTEEALALESLTELWRQRMEPADRELLIAAIQKSFLDSLVAAQRLEDRLPVIRAALRDARRDAARETLFVSPKLIWKRFLPRVMGIMPWEELKSLVKQALAPAALPAAPSALLAMNLELVRRQLLLERVAHQESVADLVPVIEASSTLSYRRRGLAALISQTPENERTECVDDLTNELSKNPTQSTPRKRGV
jgi:conjugative relaxase-like TrwC/TraI family protein